MESIFFEKKWNQINSLLYHQIMVWIGCLKKLLRKNKNIILKILFL